MNAYEKEEKKRSSFWLCELLARACRCIIKTEIVVRETSKGSTKREKEKKRKKGSTSNVVGKTWSFRVHTRLITIHEGCRGWCCHYGLYWRSNEREKKERKKKKGCL